MSSHLTFKFVIIGDTGAGKTAINRRFIHNNFDEGDRSATIGVSFSCKQVFLDNGNRISVQLWDTAGQERFHSIVPLYYRGACTIIMVYDISSRKSFENVKNYWTRESEQSNHLKVYLIGNKKDLETRRKVSYDEGLEFARSKGFDFYETSAKYENLDSFLMDMVKDVYSQIPELPQDRLPLYGIRVGDDPVKSQTQLLQDRIYRIYSQRPEWDTCCTR